MSLARFNGSVIDANGKAVPNANIEVRRSTGNRALVVVYSDREGLVPRGNPFQSDSRGRFFFHVLGGSYRVRAYTGDSLSPTFETFWDFTPVGNTQELDADQLGQYLSAGIAPFPTKAALDATTPTSGYTGAVVLNDPDATKNGWYTYASGAWQRRRGLPDTVAKMTVTGGNANDIIAGVSPGVDPANVLMFFITLAQSNTGAMTINGKPLKNALGNELVAGEYPAGRVSLLTDEGANYRLLSDPDIAGVATAVLNAAAQTAAIASEFGNLDAAMDEIDDAVESTGINAVNADSDANRAEAARDASLVAAGPVYLTEAAGRAAVVDNVQFSSLSADGDFVEKRLRINSLNSSLVSSYPTRLLMDAVFKKLPIGNNPTPLTYDYMLSASDTVIAEVFADTNDYAPLVVLSDGTLVTFKMRMGPTDIRGPLTLGKDTATVYSDANYDFSIADPNDNVIFAVSKEGVFINGLALDDTLAVQASDRANKSAMQKIKSRTVLGLQQPTKGVNLIVEYGQSLAEAMETWPALSKTQKFGNLMLGGDVRPTTRDGNSWATRTPGGLQPLIAKVVSGTTVYTDEQVAALSPGDGAQGEASGYGFANMAALLIARKNMVDPKPFCVINPAVAGKTIEQLSKVNNQDGTLRYGRYTGGLDAFIAAASAASLSYCLTAIDWLQGEYDYATTWNSTKATEALYLAALIQLRADMIADWKSRLPSQVDDPLFLIYQTGASYTNDADMNGVPGVHVGMAQLKFALNNPKKVALYSPAYPVTDKGGHLDSNGSRWMGMQAAKVYHHVVINGREWRPLTLRRVEIVNAKKVRLHFYVPEPPLVFDIPYVVNTGINYADKGFRITDVNGTKVLTSVSIVADTIVEIQTLTDIDVASALFWYASKTTFNGNGNLRDSDGTQASELYEYLAGSGMYASANIPALVNQPYPLYNWCTAFCVPSTYSPQE